MFALLALLLAAAALAPSTTQRLGHRAGWVLAAVPAAALVYFALQVPGVLAGGTVDLERPWVAALGVTLDLRLDGLALLFALLICALAVATLIYAAAYLADDPRLPRLNAILLVFTAAMLGVVLTDDVVALFVAWELTSITSYLLIGYDHHRASARDAALQALLVTAAGGLALLAGLLWLGQLAGTLEISALIEQRERILASPHYGSALALVLLGAFTKSAQFPFHFWLPGAMAAPTPISAFLHSATMVKAGVYLLARLEPGLGGTDLWRLVLCGVGGFTFAFGAVTAYFQSDLKRILAFTTVSALGALVMCIGISTAAGQVAALGYLVAHALYKGPLFHVAGLVDHGTGTRNYESLGGLGRRLPFTAAVAGAAALSMAGLPPLVGAVAKGWMHEAEHGAPLAHGWLLVCAQVATVSTVAVAAMVGGFAFWRRARPTPQEPHEGSAALWAPAAVLVGVALAAGLFPGWLYAPLVAAAAGVAPAQAVPHALPGPGLGPWVALGLGVLLAWRREDVRRVCAPLAPLVRFGPQAAFWKGLGAGLGAARAITRTLQSGYLRRYVFMVLAAAVFLAGYPLFSERSLLPPRGSLDLHLHEVLIASSMILAAIFVARTDSRLAAVVGLGIMGIGTALQFLILGGPDLAMTQLAVETLSVLLFVYVLFQMPRFDQTTSRAIRIRDLLLSLVVGTFFTGLLWTIDTQGSASQLSQYFAEYSLSEGRGRNVVNVILVDFRALDTMGEICVLTVAALGVFGLLRFGRPPREVA